MLPIQVPQMPSLGMMVRRKAKATLDWSFGVTPWPTTGNGGARILQLPAEQYPPAEEL